MIEISNTSTPVTILQSAPSHQHGGLGIARTLGRLGVRVYWVYGGGRAPATLSRYVDGTLFWNSSAAAETSAEYLLACGRQLGERPILIPIDDGAAIFVAEQAGALRERFDFPDQPAGLVQRLSSKKDMHFLCKEQGVPTPEAAFPRSLADAAAFAETATYPVVMKRIARWISDHQRHVRSVTIVQSPGELLEEYAKDGKQHAPNMMLQEYIPGGPEDVWMFNGFFTDSSECLFGLTGKKIRQSPPFTGSTTLGVCLKNETVEQLAIEFLRGLGYSGIVDMGFRYDRRDGQYKLLDVNPRVGTTFRLFADANGMDVVRALYLNFTGQSVKPGSAREGRKWMVEQGDLITSLRYRRLGKLTLGEWLRSLRGVEEVAWFAPDDLLPFAAMSYSSLAKGGRKLRSRMGAARVLRKQL